MKVSLNYLKQYLNFDLPDLNDLVEVIGRRLGALEDQPLNLADLYKDVIIVRVEDAKPIKGTDHLNICRINDGQKKEDATRDSDGLISVVCGAPNVKSGMLAAWLPPGSVVPSSYHKEPLVMEVRNIRGEVSNGMLASAKELAISDDHEGLMVIDNSASPGDSFISVYQLDDYILDIENKMFTHRPDCFGLLGVAREVSGILGHPFESPAWYVNPEEVNSDNVLSLEVHNELPELVTRFSVVAVSNIQIEPSPPLIQSYLSRLGVRPINNIIDLTNMVMLETGQPLHAYDYNKLKSLSKGEPTITVRNPRPEETLKLLNGKAIKPPAESIAIAADQLIGLGGVMGGANSEIDDQTTAIVLESASFDMYSIRRTSMEVGVFSEAVSRFNKGQSPLQTVRVLEYALAKLKELLPGITVASKIIDDVHLSEETLSRDSLHPAVTVDVGFVNERLGTKLTAEEMATLLKNVECQVEVSDQSITVRAPFWRTDLEIREDVVEEIGRLYGFENIKPEALVRRMLAIAKNKEVESKAEIRSLLSAAGANELLTYTFVSKRLMEGAGQASEAAYALANSLSPELEFYRLSLTPSLLAKVQLNIKAGFSNFALFEIGSYHLKGRMSLAEPEVPAEYSSLALVYTSKNPRPGAAYFRVRAMFDFLLTELNIKNISFRPLDSVSELDDHLVELVKPFNKNRSALIMSGDKQWQWGVIGEYTPSAISNLKLPKYSAGFELDSRLFLEEQKDKTYKRLSKYPAVKQDITLAVPSKLSYVELSRFLPEELAKLAAKATSFEFNLTSIFKPKEEGLTHYTYHLEITDETKTLKDQEVNDLLDKLAGASRDKLGASRV